LLKQLQCPHCDCFGYLIRHSWIFSNDSGGHSLSLKKRGQRAFCSDRDLRKGCGRTFAIYFADILPRHTATAAMVYRIFLALQAGHSLKKAAEGISLALESCYGLRRRMRLSLDRLRIQLTQILSPPASEQSDPVLQTFEHLCAAFSRSACPPAAFQLHFRLPFMG